MSNLASSSPVTRSLDMSLREWIEYFQNKIVLVNVRYRGVLTWKNVLDLWIIQEIIHDIKPRLWSRLVPRSAAPPYGSQTRCEA